MDDRCPELGLYIIAHEGQPSFLETLRPGWVAGDEDRHIIDKSGPGFQRTLRIKARCLLRANRKIVQNNLGSRFLERLNHSGHIRLRILRNRKSTCLIVIGHVLGIAVQDPPHHNPRAAALNVPAKYRRTIWLFKNCFNNVPADLSPVYVKRCYYLDLPGSVTANLPVHEADSVRPGYGS